MSLSNCDSFCGRNYVWMNFREWYAYVRELTEEKEMDFTAVKESLVNCGPPASHNTTVYYLFGVHSFCFIKNYYSTPSSNTISRPINKASLK